MRRDNYDPDNATDRDPPDHTAPSGQVAAGPATSSMRGSESDIQKQAGKVAQEAEEKASKVKEKAFEQASAGQKRAASGLHSAAEQVRSRTAETEGTRAQVMTKAAETMDKSAEYLEEHEPQEMWESFEKMVKDHPIASAGAALVAGLIVGRILL